MKNCFAVFCCCLGLIGEFNLFSVNQVQAAKRNNNLCPAIQIKNGLVKKRGKGRVVKFICVRGFLLAGERLSTCVRGKWDPEPSRCVRPTCKPINQQITNENVLIYQTHNGAVQHFFCKAGYKLNGPTDIYCNGTIWDNHIPTCIPVNEKPKLFCDFESTDLCGWTHDLNHDFDWIRENYNTPSGTIGTGPSFDHTKGKGQDGYYMYIESSSRSENDTARLISPVYDQMTEDVCFEFFYHMYGATIGTLRVYLKNVNESWELNPKNAFFTKSGNQGDRWYRSFHHLGGITNEFQIIIEGVRGNGYVSDIAVDDVRVIPNCQDEIESTTMMDTSTYNEILPTIDTCDDRCGEKEPIGSDHYHLTCDCDDNCYDNNRCCPDYYDICADIDEYTTPAEDSAELFTTQKIPVSSKPIPTTKYVVFNKTATSKNKIINTTPVTVKMTTKATTRIIPHTTRPVVYLQTPPPTPFIYRKTTTTTSRPATRRLIRTTPIPTTRRVLKTMPPTTTIKPTTRSFKGTTFKPMATTKLITTPGYQHVNTIDDAIEVPRPTDIDEGSYDTNSGSKEYWSDEIENTFDAPFIRNFNESNKLFSQINTEETNSHFVVIAMGVCAAVVCIAIVVFVIGRRYRFSRRILRSSNGESQSDVRFLANSDMLDLSIANNYDELLS